MSDELLKPGATSPAAGAFDTLMSDALARMPDGPMAGKCGVLIAALGRVSGLEATEFWAAVAATFAVANGSRAGSFQALVPDDDGEPHLLVVNSDGSSAITRAEAIPLADPGAAKH